MDDICEKVPDKESCELFSQGFKLGVPLLDHREANTSEPFLQDVTNASTALVDSLPNLGIELGEEVQEETAPQVSLVDFSNPQCLSILQNSDTSEGEQNNEVAVMLEEFLIQFEYGGLVIPRSFQGGISDTSLDAFNAIICSDEV